jgi:hypothetical protein
MAGPDHFPGFEKKSINWTRPDDAYLISDSRSNGWLPGAPPPTIAPAFAFCPRKGRRAIPP